MHRSIRHCVSVSVALPLAALFLMTAVHSEDDSGLPPEVALLLQEHCIHCHGADNAEGGLRLDTAVSVLRGGDSGEPTVVPGHSDRSYLMARVTADDAGERMPPDSDPLTDEQTALLRRWINAPAHWQQAAETLAGSELDHWAFLPVVRPNVPETDDEHPVDAFVSQRLAESGLERSKRAERQKLIRRLSLVMHGLPPTPERVEAFLKDDREDAWTRLVEEVLSSEHYGERWATFWLDLVRFAETDGFETNRERPHAWHYRDWVIRAFNDDKPYDQFVTEQLVGDALGEDAATGFLVAGPHDVVKGQDKALGLMQRQDELDGIINSTGATFLGLTLGCARCHNHKFDPVQQADYYALQAVFAGVSYANRTLPPAADHRQQMAVLDEQIIQQRDTLIDYARTSSESFLLLDDQRLAAALSAGIEHLKEPSGLQDNALDGVSPADRNQQSPSTTAAGLSSTVWTADPGTDVAVWRPYAAGTWRVWLSWGAGDALHSANAVYWLDEDGDVSTKQDRRQLAVVDQRQTAAVMAGAGDPAPGDPQWSGFLSAGVHSLSSRAAVVLQNGSSGRTVTADAILLERVAPSTDRTGEPALPPARPPVTAALNVESFPAIKAAFVRFVINRSSSGQPCLDELEVFSGSDNVGLSSAGAVATSSGDFVHPLHKLVHLNDGEYGNSRSWIASTPTDAWVQLQLKSPQTIDRIVWSRDRLKKYRDRIPMDYRIEVSVDGTDWQTVASSADRLPEASLEHRLEFDISQLSEEDARQAERRIEKLQGLIARRQELEKGRQVWAGRFQQPPPTHRLYRGDPMSPREEVSPGAVQSLTRLSLPSDAPEQQRRLEIARWITAADNPLTARVIANRVWQHHFGTGIVDTPSDLGRNGSPPTHPELLDWLATELVENDWSLKHLHRVILMSATWQQDSVPREDALEVDAGSRLLWRFPQRRLEAEGIRDSVLAVSGRLNLQAGGPGFSAFEVAMENVRHYFPKKSFAEGDWRRMVYMTKVRQERDAVFGTFDCPDCSQLVPSRSRSTTPLQAMGLLNSHFMMEQAQFFADRLSAESDSTDGRIRRAWNLCFSRLPDDGELQLARQAVSSSGWREFARAVLNANEFVFIP